MGQAPPGGDCNKERRGTVFVKAGEFADRFPIVCEWTTRPLKLAKSGDVLVCVVGATAGKINLAIDCAIGRSVAAIRPSAHLATEFLYHFLATKVLFLRAQSQGLAQGVITRDMLNNLEIPLPPLVEQRRIAEVLGRAEDLRAKRRTALAQLDAITQSLFLEFFGMPKENAKGWPLVPLMEICSPKQWPTISTPELTQTGFPVFGANGLIGHYTEYNHEEPTVLITCRGATCGTINVSPPQCYVTGNAMALDNPDPQRITIEYLESVLKMRSMADTISGTAQPQITRQNLQHVTLPVPPLSLQQEYARRIAAVETLKTSQRASLQDMDALFASLQHRAFRGEL
jgi:type I restriction enzyme S subunit